MYWARQKISALMDQTSKGGAEEVARKAVLDVALTHHLVSQFTSLVAVDITPARPTDRPETERDQATNLAPAQDHAVLTGLPKTATSGQLNILLGLAALVFAGWLWKFQKESA